MNSLFYNSISAFTYLFLKCVKVIYFIKLSYKRFFLN